LRWLCVSILAWAIVFVLADLPSWWLIVAAAMTLELVGDVLWVSYRVRRDRRRRSADRDDVLHQGHVVVGSHGCDTDVAGLD
jgi:hypothetical protein